MQSPIALGSRAAVRVAPVRPVVRAITVTVSAEEDRFRLNNLGPAPGSRKRKTRKGRGHAAGQVCGAPAFFVILNTYTAKQPRYPSSFGHDVRLCLTAPDACAS